MKVRDSRVILLVDDDPYIRESVFGLLVERGYEVVPCANGDEAMNAFLKGGSNLILTDIKMPGMSGIELLEKIHVIDSRMPVILMTGFAELDTAINAIKQGAFDFITKPYDPDHLVHSIDRAFRYSHLLQLEEDYKTRLEETVRHQTQEIFNLSREVIRRLTAVAEFRDTGTGAHISRIGLYANKLAEDMNMPIDFVDSITYACSMHDIGKIGIPDKILLKPGPLTPREFNVMKEHTNIGYKILEGSSHEVIKMAASVALNHHERFDGSGYPGGLRGEDIPIEGRIAIICDQYDALMSARPYKDSMTHNDVVQILTQGDGRTMPEHFDPAVLESFVSLARTFEEIFLENQD